MRVCGRVRAPWCMSVVLENARMWENKKNLFEWIDKAAFDGGWAE